MINKTRLLTGLALGCVLSTPALAEEYRGFYFSVWGGNGMVDMPSRSVVDDFYDDAWLQDVLDDIADDVNSDPGATSVLTLDAGLRDDSTLDDNTGVWGALGGYRINKWVGAEIGYVHLGEVKYDFDGTITATFAPGGSEDFDYTMGYRFASAGPTAAVVGFLPAGKYFEFNAKAGIFLADTRETVRLYDVDFGDNFFHTRVDSSQTEIFAGIGATWNATENLAIRLEFQRFFDVGDDDKQALETDVDVINLGVVFR
jgi:OmpA-OmpF porin, OOP family